MAKHIEMIEEFLINEEEPGSYYFFDNHGLLIRCKDCNKHTQFDEEKLYCELLCRTVYDDFYCGYAEIKDDE